MRTNGVVRKLAKRPGREPGDGLWVQLPPTLLRNAECRIMNDESNTQVVHHSSFLLHRFDVSAGHWRAQVAVTHPHLLCRFNSCPTHLRRVRLLARSPVFQAGQMGSKPIRASGRRVRSVFGPDIKPKNRQMLARKPNAPYNLAEWRNGRRVRLRT